MNSNGVTQEYLSPEDAYTRCGLSWYLVGRSFDRFDH
jgi:hypothetical protein